MMSIKSIGYAQYGLIVINFLAVLFNASIYLFVPSYVVNKGLSYALLTQLESLPDAPEFIFFGSFLLYGLLLLFMWMRKQYGQRFEEFELVFIMVQLLLTVFLFLVLQRSYNGIFLLVFADIFYHKKEWHQTVRNCYWLALLMISFLILLLTDTAILSLVISSPSIDTYISFAPSSWQLPLFFIKNGLVSLNMIVFLLCLVFYIAQAFAERQKVQEELEKVSSVNDELNHYVALSEKIVEDRERKRIAREIHDTLGHALTGISAGVDAVRVLVDRDTDLAKAQLDTVSKVVREGITDVRRSINKLRPGALENQTLQEALKKMISEYEEVSHLKIKIDYHWGNVDLDSMKEDVIFRVIQESITNSLRHGHAKTITIEMTYDTYYQIRIKDDGQGSPEIVYGYGLKQITERLAIIGGYARFDGRSGFETKIIIPKLEGEQYD